MSVDVNYFSFSPSRADKNWTHFDKKLNGEQTLEVKPTSWMENFIEMVDFNDNEKEEYILGSLIYQDLIYGAVSTDEDFFGELGSNSTEYLIFEAFAKVLESNLAPPDDHILVKDFLIKLFSSLNKELIEIAIEKLSLKSGWDREESRENCMMFLHGVRPVAKDLKENSDSIFVYFCNEIYPLESQTSLLLERAKQHYETYIKPKLT